MIDYINLVIAADKRFVNPLMATLHSAARHASLPIRVCIFTPDIEGGARYLVEDMIGRSAPEGSRVEWHVIPLALLTAQPRRLLHINGVTYARLYAPEKLQEEVKRFIYLDSDMLVEADLAELWRLDLEGKIVGAVCDSGAPTWGSPCGLPYIVTHNSEFALRRHFNAGLLVCDVDKWIKSDVSGRINKFIQTWRTAIVSDQDCLNFVLHEQWTALPMEWNLFAATLDERSRPLLSQRELGLIEHRSAKIWHFAGSRKPWNHFGADYSLIYKLWIDELFLAMGWGLKKRVWWYIKRAVLYSYRESRGYAHKLKSLMKNGVTMS